MPLVSVTAKTGHTCSYKFRQIRHLPSAILIYCGDNHALQRNLPAIARYLVTRGRLTLVLDMPVDGPAMPGFDQPGKMPRFVRVPSNLARRTTAVLK